MSTSKPRRATRQPGSSLAACDVWRFGRHIARLHREGDFKHVLTYAADAGADEFVSLTMPVQGNPWEWPELHPFFRMNLPEGDQLGMLKEAFGPRLDGTDLTLLGLVGANGIGRIQIVPEGQSPTDSPEDFDLGHVLKGDNSESAFRDLLRQHLRSGVSGVMPKLLSPEQAPGSEDVEFRKASFVTPRAIIKGSSARLPHLALNEHLTMEVARRSGMPAARTLVSEDGLALVVERFDTDAQGHPVSGVEDFCSLLAMRPAEKYDTTWERIAQSLRSYVPAAQRAKQLETLLQIVVLNYVVRNADCHSKNVALIYGDAGDVRLAPAYDVVTTVAYTGFRDSPPGLLLGGKKSWAPGSTLGRFAQSVCGVAPRKLKETVERVAEAALSVFPDVVRTMNAYPDFHEIGKRMLLAWEEGIRALTAGAKSDEAPQDRMRELVESNRFSPVEPEPRRGSPGRGVMVGPRTR